MSIFSWLFPCSKAHWLSLYGKHEDEGCTLYVKRFLFLVILVFIQPRRKRIHLSQGIRIFYELPFTVCLGRISFREENAKLSGVAFFQLQEALGVLLFLLGFCFIMQALTETNLWISLLAFLAFLLIVTPRQRHDLLRLHRFLDFLV